MTKVTAFTSMRCCTKEVSVSDPSTYCKKGSQVGTHPSIIPAPAAIARNCSAVLRSSFHVFGPVSNISGITPTVPTNKNVSIYMHMYASLSMGGTDRSHKNVDASRSWLLKQYYSNKVRGHILEFWNRN